MRSSIDYPGGYKRMEVFDEVIATVLGADDFACPDGRLGGTEVPAPGNLARVQGVDPMAPDPLKTPQIAAFPASKLAPSLRAIADPEGKGELTPEQADAIRQVEANVARREERG
jgi:hypothetical protein